MKKHKILKILTAMLILCGALLSIVQTGNAGNVVYITAKPTTSYFLRKAIKYSSQIPNWVKDANPSVQTDYYYLKQYGFSRSTSWKSVPADYHYLDNNGNGIFDKFSDTQLYCMQRIKLSPGSAGYTKTSYTLSEQTKRGLLVIWQNGFPYSNMGLTDDQALYATQQAMRCWLSEQERNGNDMAVWHFNWDDIADFSNLKSNGSSAANRVWNAMVALLSKARTVRTGSTYERVSSISATAGKNGIIPGYFYNVVTVNPVNCNNGYTYSTSSMPSGSYVKQSGNTLTVYIPFNASNANRSYSLTVTGYDNATTKNMVFYAPVSDTKRQVVAGMDTNQAYAVASVGVSITTPAPNLQVHNLKLSGSKTEFLTDDTIPITASIANVLAGRAYGSAAKADLYNVSNGKVYQSRTMSVNELIGYKSQAISCNFTAPEVPDGTRLAIRITADSTGAVAETVETDNVAILNITVKGKPDLVIDTLTTDKSTYEAGDTVTVKVSVRNIGGSTAGASTLTVSPSGLTAASVSIPSLGKGAVSRIKTFTFTAMSAMTDTHVKIVATADSTGTVAESNESNNTKDVTVFVSALKPDLTFGDDSTLVSSYYEGKDYVLAVQVRNLTAQPVPEVDVQLKLGNQTVTESTCVPGNGTNIVVFRATAPTAGSYPVLLTIDPNNKIDERPPNGEKNNSTNENGTIRYDGSSGAVTTSVVGLVRNNMPDPANSELEDDHIYRNKVIPVLPGLSSNTYHTWTEYRYVGGRYIENTYWAQLSTSFAITPDPRVYIKDFPDMMESGFGVYVTATTRVDTNYDQPDKLVSPQMYWVFYPETSYWSDPYWYRCADALEIKSGIIGRVDTNSWQYPVNPYSVTNSRLHYTPVWFLDGTYKAVGQAFYGWSPAGQLYQQKSDSVEIEGDMYDRFPVLNR